MEGEFQGTCWLISDDKLYEQDLEKIIEKAGDKLKLKEDNDMWLGGPIIYHNGDKGID